jgi:hypothetical protein
VWIEHELGTGIEKKKSKLGIPRLLLLSAVVLACSEFSSQLLSVSSSAAAAAMQCKLRQQ